jgi:hypothetical protein
MDASSKDPSALASFLAATGSKNANDPLPGNVVINDECGDSLWDEVLAQHNNALDVESNRAKQDPVQPG